VIFLNNARLRLFIGAALISLSPVWVRLTDVSPSVSGFYRVFFGGAALVIFLLLTRKRLQFSKQAWWLLIIASVFFMLDLWFWHRSIFYIGPGLSTLMANFQVFFMMLAGMLFLRQMPTPMQMVAVPLALFGLSLIVGFDWSGLSKDYQLGIIFGVLTAVTYAGYLLFLRQARVGSQYRVPARELAVVSVLAMAMLAVSILIEGESFAIPGYEDLGWLVAYGVLSHCIGWLFIASSLSEVSTVEAGLALLLQPTLSFVWDVLIFDRQMATAEFVGAGIALSAIYLGFRSPSKQVQGTL
jgi:drug/metabolite transporter (DMT)-like permease